MKNQSFSRTILAAILLNVVLIPNFLLAQSAPADVNAAIRKEGMENSKIMNTLHYFTDLYGPRLTGSPNHVAAANWAAKEMTSWGFVNAALEPWDFGHPGWVSERATGLMTSPIQDTLTFEVLAWTPSTKGVVKSTAVNIVLPDRPTQEELTAYLSSVKDSVAKKIVFVGKPAVVPVTIEPAPRRIPDATAKQRFDPTATPQTPGIGGGGPGQQRTPKPGALTPGQVGEQLDKFLVDNKVALRVNDAGMDHGLMRAFNNRTFDIAKVVPTVVMRNDDFGRIVRLMNKNTPVSLEFEVRNRIVPEGKTSYNVVAEIPGTDKGDEVVMLGGHLDSWHSATGATDNAVGCAVMMEAARILKAIGVKPRRTIRVALWSGEEQGLLGSQAYVKKHFGTAEAPLPAYSKFNGYFNVDSGTGRARGMSVFGPAEASTVLREALAPFADLGVAGAISTRGRNLGGTDHTSFNAAGLPGIGIAQDPIEYFTHTWHTNLDTYERIIESDVKASAIVIAAAVYALAMRDEMLPRFKAGEMPALPPAPPAAQPTPATTPRPRS
ncbi:MAG: M20/M25/M40 family metallo-hydrolase [Pyrinomonadaceae bacterium]|nr:M20/M25/M40 family metallo-hydrolase [Pyrinomonadaceae bacterium]MBP6214025.1 M20/M25/M40 family metallo-hydrolase [Pyrinomonadaceae bacterium]